MGPYAQPEKSLYISVFNSQKSRISASFSQSSLRFMFSSQQIFPALAFHSAPLH